MLGAKFRSTQLIWTSNTYKSEKMKYSALTRLCNYGMVAIYISKLFKFTHNEMMPNRSKTFLGVKLLFWSKLTAN